MNRTIYISEENSIVSLSSIIVTDERKVKDDFSKSKKYNDIGYYYKTVRFAKQDNDVIFEFTPHRGIGMKKVYIIVKNYANTNPCVVIRNLSEISFGTMRHFEDALHDFYSENGLDLGYSEKIMKRM